MIIDTHLHVIDQSAMRYPWLSGAPALNRDFSYEEYAREAKRVGIEATLHMEVDVAPDDIDAEIDYVGRLSRQPGNLIVGAIAACRPEDKGFAAFLERQNPIRWSRDFGACCTSCRMRFRKARCSAKT